MTMCTRKHNGLDTRRRRSAAETRYMNRRPWTDFTAWFRWVFLSLDQHDQSCRWRRTVQR